MNEIELLISQFVDNELDDKSQRELFEILSGDIKARHILLDFMRLKKDVSILYSDTKEYLPAKSFTRRDKISPSQQANNYRVPFFIAAAAVVILAMLVFINRNENQNDLIQLASLQKKYISVVDENAKLIKLAATGYDIKKPFLKKDPPSQPKNKTDNRYLFGKVNSFDHTVQSRRISRMSEIIEANKSVITKDDFIGGQIIGN